MDVLLVAVKKDVINDYLGVIEEAGLQPAIVDVDTFAIENMYEYNYEEVTDKIVTLVDIGSNITNINIIKDGISNFNRDITVGSRQITEQLQKQLNLNYQTAEQLKLGVPVEGLKHDDTIKLISDASFAYINEIAKTIDFYHTSASGNQVETIYLAGGGAKLTGIVEAVQEITNIPTEIIDPFRNLIIPEKKFDHEYIRDIAPLAGVAVGLALRKDRIK
jgi:type IV pilus assembly protein PilM